MQENKEKKSEKGFTLIETMVVVVVFVAVMSLALGIFLANIRNQRTALYMQRIVSETSHALNMVEEKIKEGEEVDESDFAKHLSSVLKPEGGGNYSFYDIEENGRVTVFVETEIKIGEEDGEGDETLNLKMQTTSRPR